jgi:hypothetical protein
MDSAMAVTYPPIYTTIAKAFASVRTTCWTTAQLSILDMLIDAVCDDIYDINPRFDAERFRTVAKYRYGRIDHH